MSHSSRSTREAVAEWLLMAGFIFVVVWPLVLLDFGIWAFINLAVVGLIVWAYRAVPDGSRVKAIFGAPPRSAKSSNQPDVDR